MTTSLQQDKVICFEIHLFSTLFSIDYLPEIIHLIDNPHETVSLLETFILLEDKKHF